MNLNPQLGAPCQLKDETIASGSMRIAARVTALTLLAILPLTGLTGCSSNYEIRTTDGKTYSSQGAPQFTEGSYNFTDAQGQARRLYLSQVSQVRQR